MAVGCRYRDLSPDIPRAGLVQVYRWNEPDGTWTEHGQALLGRSAQDQFGFSVALSKDGNKLAVSEVGLDRPGLDRAGNVRVFQWVSNLEVWTDMGQEISGEQIAELFGVSLALSQDGQRMAIGSPYHDDTDNRKILTGRVVLYEFDSDTSRWEKIGDLRGKASLDWFGWDVDMSPDGNRVVAGAPRNTVYGGFVQAFDYDGTSWTQVGNKMVNNYGTVKLDDRYGQAVSLDGDRVAVGSPWKDIGRNGNAGLVQVYELTMNPGNGTKEWISLGEPLLGEASFQQMGFSVDLKGDFLSVGSPGSTGDMSFHKWTDEVWDTVTAPLPNTGGARSIGYAVAMSDDATVLVASSPSSGTRVYQRSDQDAI